MVQATGSPTVTAVWNRSWRLFTLENCHLMETVEPVVEVRTWCHSLWSLFLNWVLTYGVEVLVTGLGPYGRLSAHRDPSVTANKDSKGSAMHRSHSNIQSVWLSWSDHRTRNVHIYDIVQTQNANRILVRILDCPQRESIVG